jgi:cell division inhibitor SulA
VNRLSFEVAAAQRARWLAELAEALETARALVMEMGADQGRIDAVELYARIEAVRFEVQAMRLGRGSAVGAHPGPEWTRNLPWQRRA